MNNVNSNLCSKNALSRTIFSPSFPLFLYFLTHSFHFLNISSLSSSYIPPRAPLIKRLFPHMMGGPFFTSVPSGRVGLSKARTHYFRKFFIFVLCYHQYAIHIITQLDSCFCYKNVESCYTSNHV